MGSLCFTCRHSQNHVHQIQVRLALPEIMPDVKRTVRLPEGVTALEKVNAATSALLTDTDRRVCNEARSMHATFKAVPVRLAGVGVLGIHGASAKTECASLKCSVCILCRVRLFQIHWHRRRSAYIHLDACNGQRQPARTASSIPLASSTSSSARTALWAFVPLVVG